MTVFGSLEEEKSSESEITHSENLSSDESVFKANRKEQRKAKGKNNIEFFFKD